VNNILTKFAGVYGGPLNPEEQRDVSIFALQVIKSASAGDGATLTNLIKTAAAQITDVDDYEALMGLLDHIEKEGSFDYKKALMYGLPVVAAGLSAAPAVASAVMGRGRRDNIERSRIQVLREHPELQGDTDFNRYFDTIKRFAPDVAADPLVAGNIMIEMHRLGPAAMTPTRINELLGLQGRLGDLSKVIPDQIASIGTGISGGVRMYGDTRKLFASKPGLGDPAVPTGINAAPRLKKDPWEFYKEPSLGPTST